MKTLPNRLPLVIGVTGHRDLRDEDVPKLEREVGSFMADLRHDYLGDSETPIILLSSLAEGADRVVARVALEHGARLIVPLPMPLEEYRRDFVPGLQAGNATEFDALLAKAIAAPVMPFTTGNSLELVQKDSGRRAEQYRAAGIFITQHSNLLIAVWDGDDRDIAVGGTADVVKFKREGIPLEVSGSARASLDGSEIGPVAHIETPRRKAGCRVDKVTMQPWGRAVVRSYRGCRSRRAWHYVAAFIARLIWMEPPDVRLSLSAEQRRELESWEGFGVLVALTRQFNKEAALLAATADGPERIAGNLDMLFDDSKSLAPGSPDPKQIALTLAPRWAQLYTVADTLAQDRQTQFRRDWRLLFACAFGAFLCFAWFSHAYDWKWLLAIYSLLFAAILCIFGRARIRRHQERFIDYRALAEALRVAVYWRLVGIGLRPSDVKADALGDGFNVDAHTAGVLANAFPIKQPSELAWVKICLRTLELLDRVEGVAGERVLDPGCHAIARRCWVFGQFAFFRRRGFQYNGIAENFDAWALVLLILAAFVLVPLLLCKASDAGRLYWYGRDVHTIILTLIGLLPGLAAAMTGYSERLAYNAQARQYDRMRVLFERAYALLPERIEARTSAPVRAVYRELGIEAMKENAEWVAIYRQRPIQPLQ